MALGCAGRLEIMVDCDDEIIAEEDPEMLKLGIFWMVLFSIEKKAAAKTFRTGSTTSLSVLFQQQVPFHNLFALQDSSM